MVTGSQAWAFVVGRLTRRDLVFGHVSDGLLEVKTKKSETMAKFIF